MTLARPHVLPAGVAGRVAFVIATVLALVGSTLVAAPAARAAEPPPLTLATAADTSIWGANGRVMDIVPLGTKALIGGGFDYVGPTVGHTARTNPTTGALLGTRQMVTGDVYTTISDGAGGWYLGGEFGDVSGSYRRSVAHVRADGSLDRDFNARVNGPVRALALVGGTLIVGGKFTEAGGVARTNLAAVSAATGDAVPGWTGSTNNTVYSLTAAGASVYVGGQFTTLSGASRKYLGRVSATTGALETTFTGQTSAMVRALALNSDSSTLYVGGDFTSVSSQSVATASRGRAAAFATASGAVQAWNPSANGIVRAVEVEAGAGLVHLGGDFTSVGGQTRTAYATLDGLGVATSRDLGLSLARCPHDTKSVYGLPATCPNTVDTIDVSAGRLLIGGQFGQVLGQPRHHSAEIDLATGALTGWNPVTGNRVYSLLRLDDEIVAGGAFTSVGGL
ncbi:MAG: hypothetical protein ACRCXL_05025, partial [Dermatophilaceae bacterium]